ncbi:MAG: response regulator [Lentisphaeria bacterium]|nr:response regulator [Lentisphaeria bacterium]
MNMTSLDCTDNTLSSEERLGDLLAFSNGLAVAMEALCSRLGAYNDLLQEELEDNPGAAAYLEASDSLARRGLSWACGIAPMLTPVAEFEPIDLRPLLEEAVKRSSRILPLNCTVELEFGGGDMIIEGVLPLLQTLCVKGLSMYVARHGARVKEVVVEVCETEFSEADLRILKSRMAPGRYALIVIRPADIMFDKTRLRGFWDTFLADETRSMEEEIILLQFYGTTLQHAGDIFFQEEDDDKPLACLAFPLQADRQQMQAHAHISDTALFGTETILLVDDEDMIWDVIIDMLQDLGYSVVLAENGLDAIEIYQGNPGSIDLVMLDMIMPKLDGHQTFFRLRETDPEVRVLLCSGYVSENDVRDVLEAGAAGFLQKPYRMVDLAKHIRAILDTKTS